MKIKLQVEGLSQLERDFQQVTQGVLTSRRAVEGACRRIKYRAQSLVRVQTGKLRDSIDYEMRGPTLGVVGLKPPGDSYWYFVEFGTVDTPAKPFFRPAVEAETRPYVAEVEMIVTQACK